MHEEMTMPALGGLLFVALALPSTYALVGGLTGIQDQTQQVLLHGLVYFLVCLLFKKYYQKE